MAQLDEIIGKENISQFVDLDAKINKVTDSYLNLFKVVKETRAEISSNTDSWTKLKTVQEQTAEQTKKLGEAEKQAEKITKEQAAAVASLEKQRQAAYATMAKQEAKERELAAAITMEVKSIKDAEVQNRALMEAKKKLNLTTADGKKKNEEYNKTLNKNTEFIRANSDAATKQRMNIGNYASALKGIGSKIMAFASGLGIAVGAMAAFKSIMSSTDAVADFFQEQLSGLKEGMGFLARSIVNLDFTNLIQGFRDAFNEGKRYAQVLDEIEDRQRALGIQKLDIEGQIIDQKIIARNRALDLKDREAAVDKIIELEEKKLQITKEVTEKAVANQLQSAAAIAKVDENVIRDFIANYDKYIDRIKEGNDLQEYLNSLVTTYTGRNGVVIRDYSKRDEAIKGLNDTQKESLMLMELDNTLIKEKKDLIGQVLSADINAVNEQKSGLASLSKLRNSLYNELIKEEKEQTVIAAAEADNRAIIAKGEADRKLTISKMGTIAVEQVITDEHIIGLEAREQADIDFAERELERLEEQKQARIQSARDYVNAAAEIGQSLFDTSQMLLDQEVQDMEQAKAYELQLAGDNADKRAAIEKKYEKEAAKLKTKQAKQDKAQALFNAIIKTAQAVLAGLAFGPPLGYIFAALNAVLGAIQIGIISSQPIPQFFKGTKNAPDGLISVAEKGEELIKTRSGKVLMATRPTLLGGMKGATIYSNRETEEIMKYRNIGYDSKELRQTLKDNNRDLIRTIQNKREIYLTTPKGSRITERQGDYWVKKLS